MFDGHILHFIQSFVKSLSIYCKHVLSDVHTRLQGKPVASGHAIGEINVLLLVVFSIPVIAITVLIGTILRLIAPFSVSA